ncbi:hypothetical protein FHR83_002028 [Actinoplanes campanulatus]|uniref:Uncharacterized protein n=1 Tax=Actinoplanes campanulatus TaxID=113559 RepID=A0A7W5FDJ9_9ACTN|nr:hypothetical protein [Actinoplanes campanulatus]MBB3094376.1 hypothetical protein [Actinoplanes campanulatus]GGN20608.1 hypothetical protein GCM10010109_34410 [Actinoplanes campanulatus]GID35709.1 hypothetical protein Aca09nite_22150 [Actinoplanes campanulatus]
MTLTLNGTRLTVTGLPVDTGVDIVVGSSPCGRVEASSGTLDIGGCLADACRPKVDIRALDAGRLIGTTSIDLRPLGKALAGLGCELSRLPVIGKVIS